MDRPEHSKTRLYWEQWPGDTWEQDTKEWNHSMYMLSTISWTILQKQRGLLQPSLVRLYFTDGSINPVQTKDTAASLRVTNNNLSLQAKADAILGTPVVQWESRFLEWNLDLRHTTFFLLFLLDLTLLMKTQSSAKFAHFRIFLWPKFKMAAAVAHWLKLGLFLPQGTFWCRILCFRGL